MDKDILRLHKRSVLGASRSDDENYLTFRDSVVQDDPVAATRADWMWACAQRSARLAHFDQETIFVIAFRRAMPSNAWAAGSARQL